MRAGRLRPGLIVVLHQHRADAYGETREPLTVVQVRPDARYSRDWITVRERPGTYRNDDFARVVGFRSPVQA